MKWKEAEKGWIENHRSLIENRDINGLTKEFFLLVPSYRPRICCSLAYILQPSLELKLEETDGFAILSVVDEKRIVRIVDFEIDPDTHVLEDLYNILFRNDLPEEVIKFVMSKAGGSLDVD